jgi:hypothetical protein
MPDNSSHINYFGQTDFRGKKVPFGIKSEDRARHMYVIGKTGMGKSTVLENLAIQDIKNGEGLAFIDPHGKSAELLLDYVPEHRIKDVIYFAPFDLEHPIAFNIMEDTGRDQRHLVANGLMSTFKNIWGAETFSARMEYILSNTVLALLEYPESTLLGVGRMFGDKNYRQKVVDNITDPSVKSYWVDEFASYTDKFAAEATPAIQNKIGQYSSNPLIRNIIGQTKSSIDFRKVMDEKKILIVNLSKGRIGEDNARLIGGMLVTKLYLAAMSRANISDRELQKLPPFYLYVDEFQSFVNESFADILSEARKYKLALTIAHQYVEQMTEEVSAAVFGNVGSMLAFRVGPMDAEILEKMFFPTFTKEDLVNLGRFQMYLSLMIDGVGSQPFSATTLPPIPLLSESQKEQIIESSRKLYARPKAEVEEKIVGWIQAARDTKTAGGASGGAGARSAGRPRTDSKPASSATPRYENRPREAIVSTSASAVPPPAPPVAPVAPKQSVSEPISRPMASITPSPKPAEKSQFSPKTASPTRTASLSQLTQKTKDKGGSDESKQALRNALQELMGDETKPKTEVAKSVTATPIKVAVPPPVFTSEAKKPEVVSRPNFDKDEEVKQTIPEIPEDILKKMLNV